MNHDYDAIVIGAGVIGVCTGFELAKRGYRTLNVDKQPAAGSGSTCNTCAIIRLHYSTPDGCAMARRATSTGSTGGATWACPTRWGWRST